MIGKNDVFDLVVEIGTHIAPTTTYLGDALGNYPRTVWLEKGYLWEVVDFRMKAATNYANASDSYKFYLKDASGNVIATVSTAGVYANPATGIDSSPVAAYKQINTVSAGSYLQVVPVQSGAGRTMAGVAGLIRIQRKRSGT